MAEQDPQYKVGYGKTPPANRFQKGVSGNPKGRPKGSINIATMVLKVCRQKVQIKLPGGGTRTVTKLEAAVMQFVNKSAQGDLRNSRFLFDLVQAFEERMATATRPKTLTETDRPVIDILLRRLEGYQDVTEPGDVEHRDNEEKK